jgi:S1-C subfamily serine protease
MTIALRILTLARAGATATAIATMACSSAPPPPAHHPTTAESVFEAVAPSVVAILNDDRADREQEMKDTEASLGDESHSPKHVIDVSLRKDPTPHGTGFMIEGGQIVTAAHVVLRPDRLKITTRKGQVVDAELVRIDEVRDVAILRPKVPLDGVPPLAIDEREPRVGEPVWALGHTGRGYWALSWGMSGGIASGTVDMFGAKLLLFDAAVYPGFSGGPVVTVDESGKPRVVGINHAILYTGMAGFFSPTGPISSAVAASELREVAAGHPTAMQPKLAEYAKLERAKVYADLFITDRLMVNRDANDQQVAHIMGNAKQLEASGNQTRIPAVAMIFGLPRGDDDIGFEVRDPSDQVVASETKTVRIGEHQRVGFASTAMVFTPKTAGKYAVIAKRDGKELGRSTVTLDLQDDDDDLSDEHDSDAVDDGQPDVDIVVASSGNADPLLLAGIRAGWAERSYPRRVDFAWFARGTRGWSGTNVSIAAYVLDQDGTIVGRSDGCFQPELRPEKAWSCMGSGSAVQPPLPLKEGAYDIVFAINDRPVAWWPMEAAIRKDHAPGSDVDRWMKEMRRIQIKRKHAEAAPKAPAPAPKPAVPSETKTGPKAK